MINRFPVPGGDDRRKESKRRRMLAIEVSFSRPQPTTDGRIPSTQPNGEENFVLSFAMNFTKGLPHNEFGIVEQPADYLDFVNAINMMCPENGSGDAFDDVPIGPRDNNPFTCKIDGKKPGLRAWESPRSGHTYDLQGPDADALCMPPAPRVSSDELAVEMIEVYALALFRDLPFKDIADERADDSTTGYGGYSVGKLVKDLQKANWFQTKDIKSPDEQARRDARGVSEGKASLFRGSSPGCLDGPYISQFLLVGSDKLHGVKIGRSRAKGEVSYGAQAIDQKIYPAKEGVDYMANWNHWLDVQQAGGFGNLDEFETNRKFITTPRDLATYVHIDQLYQAYLTACLIMLGDGYKFNRDFPSGEKGSPRGSFATFGGPHVLAVLTEVSSRALRAVRRQKFNFHRRARPEVMGARLTVADSDDAAELLDAEQAYKALLANVPKGLLSAIDARNTSLNSNPAFSNTRIKCGPNPSWVNRNLLLPMAFPEGSPMHPAYGAGHATVAGACVTILKIFFDMYRENDRDKLRKFPNPTIYEPNKSGKKLVPAEDKDGKKFKLTIAGELNKLAANISIGRNMAGVHYYSDYFDSLRLGERVAVGIVQEQMTNYPDAFELKFPNFDGQDMIIKGGGCKMPPDDAPKVFVLNNNSRTEAGADWWLCKRPPASAIS